MSRSVPVGLLIVFRSGKGTPSFRKEADGPSGEKPTLSASPECPAKVRTPSPSSRPRASSSCSPPPAPCKALFTDNDFGYFPPQFEALILLSASRTIAAASVSRAFLSPANVNCPAALSPLSNDTLTFTVLPSTR